MTPPLAHLAPTGLGPFADGMAGLLRAPTPLLLLVALVLMAVQSGDARLERLPLLLALAWLLGGLIGLTLPSELFLVVPCTALVAVVGGLVALEVKPGAGVVVPLAAALCWLFAVVAGSALAGHAGALLALLGETVVMAALGALLCVLLCPPHPHWRTIGLRVAGSWITAACLLMLGWLVRHPP